MSMETENKLIIRQLRMDDLEELVAFYRDVIDQLQKRDSIVKWSLEVYPTRLDIASALKAGEMHAGTVGGRIVCAFRLGGNDETYDRFDWPTVASPEEVSVIHLLAVNDDFAGRGFGTKLVTCSADISREMGKKVIRLDVLKGNTPAEKLYLKCGFSFVTEQKIFYEDTGLMDFRMFELVL